MENMQDIIITKQKRQGEIWEFFFSYFVHLYTVLDSEIMNHSNKLFLKI